MKKLLSIAVCLLSLASIGCTEDDDIPPPMLCTETTVASDCGGLTCSEGFVKFCDSSGACNCRVSGGTGGSGGSAGSGGTGGTNTDPCTAALPSGDGLFIDGYVLFDTSPGGISFDGDGILFAGNVGDLNNPAEQTHGILRVEKDAEKIDEIGTVYDPDVVIVDQGGAVADSAGNLFAGGYNDQGEGQLTELDPDTGAQVSATVNDPPSECIGNASVMLFAQDGRLLLGNFVQKDVMEDKDVPIVCEVTRGVGSGEIQTTALIPASITQAPTSGLAQIPTPGGDIFVSRALGGDDGDQVSRFDSAGGLVLGDYDDGVVLGHGPPESAFDGLLILRSDGSVDLRDPSGLETRTLLTGVLDSAGNYAAFYPNDSSARLYISQLEQRRILRVSTNDDEVATALGCTAP